MSIKDFPNERMIRYFETNEEVRMGSFKLLDHTELRYIGVLLIMVGNFTTEKIRTKIYSSANYDPNSLLYTSDWQNLIVASNTNWHGWLLTKFNGEMINKNLTYYLSCEINNYTRNLYSKYFSLCYDCPEPIYGGDPNVYLNNPLAFKIICDEKLDDYE